MHAADFFQGARRRQATARGVEVRHGGARFLQKDLVNGLVDLRGLEIFSENGRGDRFAAASQDADLLGDGLQGPTFTYYLPFYDFSQNTHCGRFVVLIVYAGARYSKECGSWL